MIDNYDSFTYNLVQYLGELGQHVVVYRNDQITLNDIEALAPSHIVISPGPCTPNEAGISLNVVKELYSKIPILGICLGMHLLSDWGEEGGGTEGLGIIEGKVSRMLENKSNRLPHVGWNSVQFLHDHPLFSGLKNNLDFYFVHSYRRLNISLQLLANFISCSTISETNSSN